MEVFLWVIILMALNIPAGIVFYFVYKTKKKMFLKEKTVLENSNRTLLDKAETLQKQISDCKQELDNLLRKPEPVKLTQEEIDFFKNFEIKKAKGEITERDERPEIFLLFDKNLTNYLKKELRYAEENNLDFDFNLTPTDTYFHPFKEHSLRKKIKASYHNNREYDKIRKCIDSFDDLLYKYFLFKKEHFHKMSSELDMIRKSKELECKEKEYNRLIEELKNKQLSINEFKKRDNIPQRVKDAVWNRDGGRCVQCGSNEKLEFDHIIPFSKGGADTYRNLQLLCENCNRSKSNKIGLQ